jgi:hypothetical protein
MASRWIEVNYNEAIDVLFPGGRKISILLSYLEPSEQTPEIDIMFDADMILNCFMPGLEPAKPTRHGAHILEGRQIIAALCSGIHRADPRSDLREGVGADEVK